MRTPTFMFKSPFGQELDAAAPVVAGKPTVSVGTTFVKYGTTLSSSHSSATYSLRHSRHFRKYGNYKGEVVAIDGNTCNVLYEVM